MKFKNISLFTLFFTLFLSLSAFSQTFIDLKNAGDGFFNKKNWVEAKRFYERAIKLNPDSYCISKITECEKRIKQNSDRFFVNVQKGNDSFNSKIYEDAKKYYQEALKLKSDEYCKSKVIECDCWSSIIRKEAAIAENYYRQFEYKNRSIEIELQLAQLFGEQKLDSKALEWYRKAADSGSKPAMKGIAAVLLKSGKDDLIAIEWINKAGEDTAPYYKIIGDRIWNSAGMQTSRYEESLLYFKKSNLSQAELKNKYNELGDILSKMGKTEEANLWYAQGGKI